MKKGFSMILKRSIRCALLTGAVFTMASTAVFAESNGGNGAGTEAGDELCDEICDEVCYISAERYESSSLGNVKLESTVTEEMCSASYWEDITLGDKDEILMTHSEISEANRNILDASGTNMFDLESDMYKGTFNAKSIRDSLSSSNPFAYRTDKSKVYVDGVLYDKNEYIQGVLDAIAATGYSDTERSYQYAVGVNRCALLALPIPTEMGWSATDPDDENQESVVDVNEPVVINQKAEYSGHTFYHCITDNCQGWVDAEYLAVCSDRDEWLSSWKVDIDDDDFIVVIQDKIVLEKSHMNTDVSEVKLTLGTVLKLVPDEDIPELVDGERGTWNNYVVYLPTRDDDGKYVRQIALISQHYSVSVGFADYTQANALRIAFSCLGNRYGWGGTDQAMDCSLFSRLISKCMGLNIPRNTTWQAKTPGLVLSIDGLSADTKAKLFETSPAGTYGIWADHVYMYTGSIDGVNYTISNTGMLSDSQGDLNVLNQYNTLLNPLTVRRWTEMTWLETTTSILIPGGPQDISQAQAVIKDGEIVVTYKDRTLYEGVNYTVAEGDGIYTITGINNFENTLSISSKLSSLTLSQRIFYYDGSSHVPSVEVTAGGLKYTKDSADLKLTAAKKKLPGTYTVTAQGNGKLTGTLKKTWSIRIKPTSIKKLTALKKGFTVKAAGLDEKYITGYRVRYSTSSTMKNAKKAPLSKSASISVKNLKKGKTYYVQIRTYKVINGVKYYSSWSEVKKVKTK